MRFDKWGYSGGGSHIRCSLDRRNSLQRLGPFTDRGPIVVNYLRRGRTPARNRRCLSRERFWIGIDEIAHQFLRRDRSGD